MTPPSLLRAVRGVHWYVKEVLGENDYDHYVAHVRRRHPGDVPVCRRDFERAKTDRLAADPRARCC